MFTSLSRVGSGGEVLKNFFEKIPREIDHHLEEGPCTLSVTKEKRAEMDIAFSCARLIGELVAEVLFALEQ